MYKHLLIATDGSELARKGIAHGLEVAKALRSEVSIIMVTEPFPARANAADGWVFGPDEITKYDEAEKEIAGSVLSASKATAAEYGLQAHVIHIPRRFAAGAIIETAGSIGADLIVMASHGRRGISKLLLGSQTVEVLAHSSVPVLVVR